MIENGSASGVSVYRSSSISTSAKLEVLNCVDNGIWVGQGSVFQNQDSANIIVKGTTGDGVSIGVGENSILSAQGGIFEIRDNSSVGFDVGRNSTLSLRQRGAGLNAIISNNINGISLYQ